MLSTSIITKSSILITVCTLLLCGHQLASADSQPTIRQVDHYLLHDACGSVLNEQISWELYASLVYLNMAAYFDRPSVAKPGYAQFFKDQSLEEYSHASKFIDYINSRNSTVKRLSVDESPKSEWSSPKEALTDAIKLEKHVYGKIQHIHDVADQTCQDAHLTDFLESYYFIEQVNSIKELQEMLTTISVEDSSTSTLIEYLEDKQLAKKKKEENWGSRPALVVASNRHNEI